MNAPRRRKDAAFGTTGTGGARGVAFPARWGVVLGLCSALGWACAPGDGPSDGELRAAGAERGGVREAEVPLVLVVRAERREMVQRLSTTAVVESQAEVAVVPRVSGEALEVLAEEGDQVAQGALLARLENTEQRLAVDEAQIALKDAEQNATRAALATQEARSRLISAESSLAQARRDHERDMALAASGDGRFASVSAKAVEASALALERAQQDARQAELAVERADLEAAAARTAVERAAVALERARTALADRSLRAPFAGRVARRDLRVGQQASPSTPAFVLTDLDALQVVFARPQRELAAFLRAIEPSHSGFGLSASSDAFPGVEFEGKIERVSPTVDSASGSFRVTARLHPTGEDSGGREARLVPGLLVRLSLITDRRPDALVVPKRAVQREGESAFVLAVREGRVVKLAVREGYADDNWVEVAPASAAGEFLSAGEPVIVVGNRELEDGAPVRTAGEGESSGN